jgi:hypothetical protein
MKRLNLVIEDELDEQFRIAAFKKWGLRKGSIQKAGEEALKMWIDAQNKNLGS